ncbi:MAG: 3-hydroxyacyl-CoA dehydrogenase family protein [Actinobacteria bacterium]|nr:3-hydroxyacyl-CoA dehydrogenase family protein [Actinomycetota bacterium]
MNVTILGAGLMGQALAALFSGHGLHVRATTSRRHHPDEIRRAIRERRDRDDGVEVEVMYDTSAAVTGADIVIDCLPEDLELKVAELGLAQETDSNAVVATNTSSFGVGEIASRLSNASQVLGLHFLNPPTLLPVVEVVATSQTSARALQRANELVIACSLEPVAINDTEGFVINRLQFALLREAQALAEAGVATPTAIDTIVRDGLARRWAGSGPFETAALGGVPLFDALASRLYPHLDRRSEPATSFAGSTVDVDVSAASRRRDAVLRLLADVPRPERRSKTLTNS